MNTPSGQGGLIGALSLGEVDALQSEGFPAVPRFHNACVVVLGCVVGGAACLRGLRLVTADPPCHSSGHRALGLSWPR